MTEKRRKVKRIRNRERPPTIPRKRFPREGKMANPPGTPNIGVRSEKKREKTGKRSWNGRK